MIRADNVTTSQRMGGEVLRYHTWPTVRQQTVMDHTGNVIRIYYMIFGDVPPEVTAYLLFHDLPEVKVGDPPHPIKLHNPPLKAVYDDLEDAALEDMVGEERAMRILGEVNDTERLRMKACDLLEMAEFAHVEMCLGNRFADAIIVNVKNALAMLPLDPQDMLAITEYYRREIMRFVG